MKNSTNLSGIMAQFAGYTESLVDWNKLLRACNCSDCFLSNFFFQLLFSQSDTGNKIYVFGYKHVLGPYQSFISPSPYSSG